MRILRLTLATADLDGQAAFWGGRLGLPVSRVADDELDVRLYSSTIRFRRAASDVDARYHFAINIPPDSLDRAVEWIGGRTAVLPFHGDPDEEDGATVVRTDVGSGCFYFLDAAGNVVELISSPYMEAERDEPFGPASLIEIAEIGIATADTYSTRAAIREFFDQEILWGGGPDSLLTAIGDHHAVVIVAPVGRGWIPVDLPARPLPTEIVAAGDEPRELTLPEGPYRLRVAPA
jgi:catechol 2,3-dioxygenase-like lactoylglutathione lyase family enzyme